MRHRVVQHGVQMRQPGWRFSLALEAELAFEDGTSLAHYGTGNDVTRQLKIIGHRNSRALQRNLKSQFGTAELDVLDVKLGLALGAGRARHRRALFLQHEV